MNMAERLETVDIICLVGYFLVTISVGIWASCRPTDGIATGYFFAEKTMHWLFVGASMVANNVGALLAIALAGSAAASGFSFAILEWNAIFVLVTLGWIFVPVYVASGAYTLPEYLKKRFGGVRLRIFLSLFSLVLYLLNKISGEMYAGAIFINQMLGVDIYISMSALLLVTAIYTIAGGLAAVMYTHTFQILVLLISSTILCIICIVDIGNWDSFLAMYAKSASNLTLTYPLNHSCGMPREDFMHVWRDPVHGDIPWTGAVIGVTILNIRFWCTDQIMVQRCLAAKNMNHVKGGTVFAAFLKITPVFLFVFPGMVSRIYFPEEVACSDPAICKDICDNEAGCFNIAYPLLVFRKMPIGLKGLMIAAFLSCITSSLTSVFNSISGLVTRDLWMRFRNKAPQSELMIVGRGCVVVLVALSFLWVPIMERSQGGQLFKYILTTTSCFTPPWAVVFLSALFWRGTTEQGAFWGIVVGTFAGVVRLVMEFGFPAPFCGSDEDDNRPSLLKDVHFLHFAIISTLITFISIVSISLCTERRPPEKLRKVTWWTRHDTLTQEESDSESEDDIHEEDDDSGRDVDSISVQVNWTPPQKKSKLQQFCNWLCGQIEVNKTQSKITPFEKELIRKKMTDISESKTSKAVTSVAAVVVIAVGVFLLVFFG